MARKPLSPHVAAPSCRGRAGSGDDIGQQLALETCDPVAQDQFALFQPLKLDLVERRGFGHACDHRVEIAMFDAQLFEPATNLGLVVRFAQFTAPMLPLAASYPYSRARAACVPCERRFPPGPR